LGGFERNEEAGHSGRLTSPTVKGRPKEKRLGLKFVERLIA
jgi:hypothetical protein